MNDYADIAQRSNLLTDPVARRLDDPRFTAAVIPPNVLVHLIRLADERGVDVRAWFGGVGLTREQVIDPAVKVSYRQAGTVIRRALQSMDEPGLGLTVGCRETLGCFGLLGLAMMTARTFGEAMRIGIDNHKVCGSLLDAEFEQLGTHEVALVAWPRFVDGQLLPFLCEELFASSMMIARELLGPAFRVARIELTYAAPAWAGRYAEVFGAEVRFGAPRNRAVLDATWLGTPLPGHHPLTAQQALQLCREQLARNGGLNDEIVANVEHLLRTRLSEHPRIEDVARTLNLSERSLRRKLSAAGRAFREIHDEIRTECALELLRAGRLSVADVGHALGFSEAREFRRAFKRWTGMPPRAVRQLRD